MSVATGTGAAVISGVVFAFTLTLHGSFLVFPPSLYDAVTTAEPFFFPVTFTEVFFLAESFATEALLVFHVTFFF